MVYLIWKILKANIHFEYRYIKNYFQMYIFNIFFKHKYFKKENKIMKLLKDENCL